LAVTPAADGSAAVWIGAAGARWGDGLVEGYRFRAAELSPAPIEVVYGRIGDGGALGSEVRTYPLTGGRFAFGFGAPKADSVDPLGVDIGSVYVAAWP
jgi:hypothetical protein